MIFRRRKWIYGIAICAGLVGVMGIALSLSWQWIVENEFYPKPSDPMRVINTAEIMYRNNYPERGFSRSLAELGPGKDGVCPSPPRPSAACLIDLSLAQATNAETPKSGYFYTYTAGPPDVHGIIQSYSARMDPARPEYGTNHYYTDETRVVRVEKNKPATKESRVRKSYYDP